MLLVKWVMHFQARIDMSWMAKCCQTLFFSDKQEGASDWSRGQNVISRCFPKQKNIIVQILQAHYSKWVVENYTRNHKYDTHKTDIAVAHPECNINQQQSTRPFALNCTEVVQSHQLMCERNKWSGVLRCAKIVRTKSRGKCSSAQQMAIMHRKDKNARIRNVEAADNLTWAAFIHQYSFNLENLIWCCRVSCCTIHVWSYFRAVWLCKFL